VAAQQSSNPDIRAQTKGVVMSNSRLNGAKRKFLQGLILKAVVGSLAAWTMISPASAVTDRTGTVVATLTVTFVSAPPAGSTVSCGVALIGSDTLAPSDSKSVSAPVTNSTAVCKLTVHYKWRVESTTSTMTIAYSASGPIQTSSGIYNIITVPGNGVTTTVAVAVTQ
jgi:hypothetical protein